MEYLCCTDDRRDAVARHGTLNGIEFLDVVDDPSLPDEQRQRTLRVHFIHPKYIATFTPDNVRIEGGERVKNIAVESVAVDAQDANVLVVTVDQAGDFSVYTLRLVLSANEPALDPKPPSNFDPLLSSVQFSFKVACPTDFDCKPVDECPPEATAEPDIDYLAKDYASFRRVMLDRMAVVAPDWRERAPADLGIMMVEMLAYVADRLSYQQDAVATEAYLGTARRRVSVRRHTRLVDYAMSDGSNARTWVHLRLKPGAPAIGMALNAIDAGGVRVRFLTRCTGEPVEPIVSDAQFARFLDTQHPVVFEPMHGLTLFPQHNELPFYTWGATDCCLPKGSTRATLLGAVTTLQKGDVLVLEEVKGPRTGVPDDADPTHRHAVRLSKDPVVTQDPLGGQFNDPPTDDPVDITEIEWYAGDALPFALCVSSTADGEHGGGALSDVSVARGNIVLCDHGQTIAAEPLGSVPEPSVFTPVSADRCDNDRSRAPLPPRFLPALAHAPVTQQGTVQVSVASGTGGPSQKVREPFDDNASATSAFSWLAKDVIPVVSLLDDDLRAWSPARDLLNSSATAERFVVEVENDQTARLRFGDGVHGRRPSPGASFSATYRVGNGRAGNIGADTLAHLVTEQNDLAANIEAVRNPVPGRGGVEPESIEDARKSAPVAFRTQERAVTEPDYAEVTQRQKDLQIQRAAATFRWTGSWHTVFVTADRTNNLAVDAPFETSLRDRLERYRMAGHDVEVDGPRFVPLEMEMNVCAKAGYFRSDVKAALLRVFSSRTLPDGSRGVFHPDNFTFGQPLYLSVLYAAAMAVEGVESVQITVFQRKDFPSPKPLNDAVLTFDRLEIAQLDNDANFPERGVFRLEVNGGK